MASTSAKRVGRLAGKRIVVTGAASGIGRSTAVRFAAEGARVALVDVNEDGLEEVERLLDGERHITLVADVSDEEQVRLALEGAESTLGGLDVAIANAAVHFGDRMARVHEFDLDTWTKTLAVNLTGVFLTCKHAIPALLRAGGGSIVCTGSPTGSRGHAELCAYSASKGGVTALVRVLAAEYAADRIRVNCVVPGFTATPFVQALVDDPVASRPVLERIPLGRPGSPEEVASMMLFLASDDSTYVTGATLAVDGGRTST
jgi:NAD(P)-dependent dehydrogenase (short-subunit alcohol dehydrogenase family)